MKKIFKISQKDNQTKALARLNKPRPCSLDLGSEIFARKSFEPFKHFAFNMLNKGEFVSSHGFIGTAQELNFNGTDFEFAAWILQYPVKFWEYCRILDFLPYKPGHMVLDIGGGSSPISFFLASQGCKVAVLDYELVKKGRSIIQNSNAVALRYNMSLKAEHGDATSLPYPDASFDHVISVSVLEHVGNLSRQIMAMQEAARVLKPGGFFALTFDYGKMRGIKGHYIIQDSGSIWKLIKGTQLEIVGNTDFEDLDYTSSEIIEWEKKNKKFSIRQFRWNRWYTAFSLFLHKPA